MLCSKNGVAVHSLLRIPALTRWWDSPWVQLFHENLSKESNCTRDVSCISTRMPLPCSGVVIDDHTVIRSWYVIKTLREIWASQEQTQRENLLTPLQGLKIELKLQFFFPSLTDHWTEEAETFYPSVSIRNMPLAYTSGTCCLPCAHGQLLS